MQVIIIFIITVIVIVIAMVMVIVIVIVIIVIIIIIIIIIINYYLVKVSCFPSIVAGYKQQTWGVIGEEVTSATVPSLVCGLFQALWFSGFHWCQCYPGFY